jgi:carboxymethylenebutenolidase
MPENVTLPVGNESANDMMDVYVATPDGDARGAVVVLQEAFGVNDHIQDIARRFADAGYVSVAPHLFHRSGDPTLGYEDMTEVIPYIMQLVVNELEADLEATFEYLAGLGFEGRRVATVGFCMGGSIVFLTASYWELGAAVSFYGGGITQGRFQMPPLIDMGPTLQTPWLGLFGDLDESIPIAEVEGLRSATARAGVDTEIVRYPDANHGFHCDARDSYHESSAKDGWQRTLDWLDQHLQ